MKVSFAHLGNVYVFLEPYLASLGLEPVVPPLTSKRTLDIGVRQCPEMIRTPCKIIFGNYVEGPGARRGAADYAGRPQHLPFGLRRAQPAREAA